jgi:hypothetical protein
MTKTFRVMIFSFFLLMSSNAFAVQGKIERNFLEKIQRQLDQTQVEVREELNSFSDEELMEKYGDVILEIIYSDSTLVSKAGLSIDEGIRGNVELLFSDKTKDFLLESATLRLEEAGSVKNFKRLASKKEKALTSKNKGLGRVLTVMVSYITLPFFLIFGPWGWVYWSVLFGYWS